MNELKMFIQHELEKIISEEWWAEAYDKNLIDDPALDKRSVLVPDDIKDAIKNWSRKMGLSSHKRSR